MTNCLTMSETCQISRWVKMVMLFKYILMNLVILTHISGCSQQPENFSVHLPCSYALLKWTSLRKHWDSICVPSCIHNLCFHMSSDFCSWKSILKWPWEVRGGCGSLSGSIYSSLSLFTEVLLCTKPWGHKDGKSKLCPPGAHSLRWPWSRKVSGHHGRLTPKAEHKGGGRQGFSEEVTPE